MRRHAVHARAPCACSRTPQCTVLPGHARAEVAAQPVRRAGAARQVGRAADQVGERRGERLERRRGRLPGLDAPWRPCRRSGSPASQPVGQLAGDPLRGIAPPRRGAPARTPRSSRCQLASASAPARRHGAHVGAGGLRHEERLVGPAQDRLGLPDLVGAERRAVGLGGVALGRGRVGDDGAEHDQRGPLRPGRRRRRGRRRWRRGRCRRPPGARASRRPRSARPTSSVKASSVRPSMVMLLSS